MFCFGSKRHGPINASTEAEQDRGTLQTLDSRRSEGHVSLFEAHSFQILANDHSLSEKIIAKNLA